MSTETPPRATGAPTGAPPERLQPAKKELGWLGSRIVRGFQEAPLEIAAARAATEYDADIELARKAGDVRHLAYLRAKKEQAAERVERKIRRYQNLAFGILAGGWAWYTLALLAVLAGLYTVRKHLGVQVPTDAAVRLITITGISMVPVAVNTALGMQPPLDGGWMWHWWLLSWPALLALYALARVVIWVGPDGTIADDLAEATKPEPRKLSPDLIVEALQASTVKLPQDADPAVVAPGVSWHANGTVWRASLDTSRQGYGPSAAPILDAKGKADFGARLGLGPGRFHVTLDRDQGSRVHLTGVKGDPWGKPSRSPLVDATEWDLWQGLPFGHDVVRDRVDLQVAYRNFLWGGQPDAGKSTACYPFHAGFALSRYSRFWVIDGGEVDTRPLYDAGLCHAWTTDLHEALDVLNELNAEVERRQALLARYGQEHPGLGKKATPQFFQDLGLGFDLFLWDEFASFTNSADRKTSGSITKVAMSVLQRIRKVGIIAVLATQSPSSVTMDTDGRDVISDRLALACKTPQMSDKVLGQGHASNGYDASDLSASDKAGWLSRSEGEQLVRADLLTDADLDLVYKRGVQLRGGKPPKLREVPARLLGAVQLLRQQQVDSMRTAEVVGRLRQAGHNLPEGIRGQQVLAAEMARYDVSPVQDWSDGGKRHYLLADLERAVQRIGDVA